MGQTGIYAIDNDDDQATVVPVPAAFWLFGAGLFSLIGIAHRKNAPTSRVHTGTHDHR